MLNYGADMADNEKTVNAQREHQCVLSHLLLFVCLSIYMSLFLSIFHVNKL